MDLSLEVTIVNMCVFVLWDYGSEAWIIDDEYHEPKLLVNSQMVLPPSRRGPTIDLKGLIVTFGEGDPGKGGTEFPMETSALGGAYENYLNLLRIAGDVTLQNGWRPGDKSLAPNMVTRVALPGGSIVAEEDQTVGGQKPWTIKTSSQKLTSRSTFVRPVADVPFVRLREPGGIAIDIPVKPDANGVCSMTLGVLNVSGESTVDKQHDEVFVIEVKGFEKILNTVLNAKLPIPHTYWPEYKDCDKKEGTEHLEILRAGKKVTDPCGGPCPSGLLDFRTRSVAAQALGPLRP
jgi:hypothetical protein